MTVKKCNSNKGGGIYFDIHEQTTLEVDQLSIEGCIAKFGGGIQIAIYLGTLSITGAMSIYNCNSTEDGGGFYITNSGGIINFKTPTASQILIDQCNAQNNGGGIQSQIYEGEIQSSIFEGGIINIDNTKFSKCISITGSGGGIISTINGTSKIDIQNSIFYQCKAAGTQYGGALYLLMNAGGQGIFSGIQFDECEAGYGGGIFTNIYVDSEVILDDLIFNKCKAYEDGGGLYERFSGGGTITMNGVNQFKNCEAGRFGGGFSHWTPSESYETIINDEIQFDNCSAGAHSGGMYVQCLKLGQFSANKITIKDCHSDMIGGLYIDIQAQFTVSINEISIEKCSARICSGIYISIISKGTLSIIGAMSIYKCNSTESGSGCNITNSGGIVNLIGTTESQIFFNKCKTQFNGGGIYSEIKSGGTMNIENAKFQKCISLSDNGGGIYSTISSTSKIDIKNSIFTQCNVTDAQYGGALYLLANGQGLLSNLQFDECLAGQGGSIYSTIIGAGKLTISNQCSFENCQSTSGSGGAIYVTLSDDNSGGFYIEGTGKTTFSLCTATDKGGSIYLELGSGAETKYSLSEASYLTGNNALYGKNLFINAKGDLQAAVPLDSTTTNTKIKLSAGSDQYESDNLNNLMGYDGELATLTIPLYYVYTDPGVYHVNNPSNPFSIGSGDDNIGCGHLGWPCERIRYAIDKQSLDEDIRKIGIISGYIQSTSINVGLSDKPILIQRSIDLTSGYSNILIDTSGSFVITDEVTFQDLNFIDQGGNILDVIKMDSDESIVQISNCQLRMKDATTPIKHKFINTNKKTLSITSISIETVTSTSSDLINIGTLASSVSISQSTFGSTNQDMIQSNSRIIKGIINDQLIISITTFYKCINNGQSGGALNLEIVNNGQVELNGVIMIGCKGTSGGAIYSTISGTGKLTIKDQCQFTGCQATSGSGGAIYTTLSSTNIQGVFISGTGKTTFSLCTATDKGGSIYLELGSGAETKYSLSEASYLTGNNALYGKNLFINAKGDLQAAVPLDSTTTNTKIKLSAGSDQYESDNLNNLMGYDNYDGWQSFEIPLYYVYTKVDPIIFHVNNQNENSLGLQIGNDNRFCGHLLYSCKTIQYSIKINRFEIITSRSIGIITGYIQDSLVTVNQPNKEVKIQNSYDNSNQTTDSKSEFLFQDQGKISIIAGTLSFEKITLIINSTAAAEVEYIIAGTTEQTEIKITDCLMRMQSITTSYSIKVGLVELSVGKLTISKLDVKDITIASYSIIKVNSGSGIVDISESKFNNISRTGASGKGSVLQVEFNSYIGKLIMSEVTMNQCSAKNGGAIYSSLIEGSSMIIKDSSSFSECKSIAGNGGAMYIDIDLTSQSKFELIDTTFQSCQSKDSTPPSSSTSPFGFGGAIFITAQGQYDPLKNGKALKGALFDSNSALNGGQNLYVVMQELIQFCRTGEFGEYVKGNYIDQNQNKSEIYYQNKSQLEGISKSLVEFQQLDLDQIQNQQIYLEYYWEPPPYLIWHILDKIPDQGQNYRYCGRIDEPCLTIDFIQKEISHQLMQYENEFVEIKQIGINPGGYELSSPIKINPSSTYTNNLLLMKQLYETSQAMKDQGQLIIKKENNNNKENEKLGWIEISDQMNMSLYYIDITTDGSTLTIPIICINGQQSILELNSVQFIEIQFSPITNSKGIIQSYDNIQLITICNSTFQDININGVGGNAIRINNDTTTPTQTSQIEISISNSNFININMNSDNNQKEGGSAIYAEIGTNGILNIEGYSIFEQCICNKVNGGAIYIILNGGSFVMQETQMYNCKALNGGAVYALISSMNQFLINEEVYFEECDAFSSSQSQGRGGAIYINVGQDAPYEFTVGVNLHFNLNKASQYGRDLFIYCKNIIVMKPDRRILYDMLNETYDKDNAIFGTEYAQESELGRPQMIDFDILSLMLPYYNDIIYISQDQSISENTLKCGRIYLPCVTLSYAEGKIFTPEWTAETVPQDSSGDQQINHTYIIFQGIEITSPFESEADNVIIRGAFPDEYLFATERAILIFTQNGQIICSDLAQWQQQGQLEKRSINQNFFIHHLEFVLTDDSEIKSIMKIIGSSSHNNFGRNVELQIEDCIIIQESPLYNISCGFIKSEPLITQLIRISIVDVIAQDIFMVDTALIDLQYEPDVIQLDNILSIKKCSFTNIESSFLSSSLQLRTQDIQNMNYIGTSSVINVFGDKALLLPILISKSTFESCKCNLDVSPSEERLIRVGGTILFIGRNLHINFEHLRFIDQESNIVFVASDQTSLSSNSQTIQQQQSTQIVPNKSLFTNSLNYSPNISSVTSQSSNQSNNSINKSKYQIEISGGVYIGIIDSGSEWVAISQKRIIDKLQEQGLNYKTISRRINDLCRPSIIFDICVIKECKTTKSGLNSAIPILKSGGVILHSEKSLTRCNFNSSIFLNCLISTQSSPSSSTQSSPSSSTNLALNDPILLQNTPFESLWLREKEFGVKGSGLIVAYGRTIPSIKADGIQCVGCDAIHLDIYSSTSIKHNANIIQQQQQIRNFENNEQINISNQFTSNIQIKHYISINPSPPPSQDISHLFSQTNYKFNNNHFTIKLLFGSFSSQTILLEEQMLELKGQGENESLLIQKNISQTLFVLQNSQLNSSFLSAQLWGAEVALIRSQGNGMSIIDGLRVNGVKQESAVVHCSVFEVISGELSLIDIHIKDINISENYNEINPLNERNKMKGLIEMKENAKVLYIEKFVITNINIENINKEQRMSSIIMNAGHLKLKDSTFLGEAYTSIGSAIRAYPTGPSTIDVEGVLFKGLGDGQGTNGGAVYVDMRQFDVQMSFKRCIFIGNKADYGSNVFIRYSTTSQRINRNSFIGCTSIVENSQESDISVCYSIGDNDNEIFIDERNLIHSSWNRQKSEGVVRFIANSDFNHTIDSSLKCGSISKPCNTYQTLIEYIQFEHESDDGSTGRVETLIFGEGKISSPFIDLSLARSDIINIVGCGDQLTEIYPQQSSLQAMIYSGFNQIIVVEKICIANSPASPLIGFIRTQGAESGLVMQDMRVQGYLETSPYNTMLEPPYLFSIEGFVHLQDVIFEHIYLRTGTILQVVGLRRIADDSRIEQLGKTSIGFYRCIFDDITSNESVLISLNEKDLVGSSTPSEINKISNVQNSEKTTKFVIEDTIFSDCATSLLLGNKNAKGGLLNLKNKKVRFEILNSEYRNIAVKSRNMLYLAWGVYEPDSQQINILTITETFFTNCSALIPEMDEKVVESQITQGQQPSNQTINQFINIQQSNELYTNGSIIFDNLYKYGLIFINNLNQEINDSINLATIDITSLFMSNCHSAIGSALTVTRLTLNLQESVFVEPMCYGNMLYLNQTQTSINNCYFNGYNNTLSDIITEDGQSISDAFCPNNPQYFSSIEYALVYITLGRYISNNDIYKDTRIGAIRIDSAVVELKNVQFSDPWEESSQLDGSLLMIACKGESYLNIIDPTVNQMTEENCKEKSQNSSSISNENENECQFGIVFDDICKFQLSDAFKLPPMPVPRLKSAKVVVNVDKDQEAMQFVIEGEQFVLSLFTVQIVELENKTIEEIKEEQTLNKQQSFKYSLRPNSNNNQLQAFNNSRMNLQQIQISNQDHKTSLFTPLHISHNSKFYENSDQMNDELVRDDKGYLIWPLKDATKLPIFAHGKVRSSNKAKFSMRDYSWLDNRQKWYGIQISNDRKQFYGLDGGNESVRLEVEIEEGEQFVNFIRFQLAEWWAWVVPPIVVGSLTLIISGIVYILWKDRYEKNKEVEHLKELQEQKQKRLKLEEINHLDQDLQNEDGENHTMIITEEDEVKTQLPKVNLTESQSSIHFISIRNAHQQTQSQNLLESESKSQSSSTLPIKQKSHLQINPRDDEQFADVMKVIDKVSQSSSQSENIPSVQQQLETPQAWQEQLITESYEAFPNLTRVPSHSSTTSLFISTNQSSSLFQTNQSIIPQSSSSQSISKLTNLSSTNQNHLSNHFDRLELLLQTLENKKPIIEKHPLATCEYDQQTDIIQTSDTNINVKSKSNMTSSNNLNTKINNNTSSLHKQKPKHHSSSQSKATFTGFLADQEAPDIDFSLISSDSSELERVVWGPSGPPATLSLAKFGIFVPTPEILQLQRRQSIINDQIDQTADEQNNDRSVPNIQQKVYEKEQLGQNDLEHKQKENSIDQEKTKQIISNKEKQKLKINVKTRKKSLQKQDQFPHQCLSPVEEDIE